MMDHEEIKHYHNKRNKEAHVIKSDECKRPIEENSTLAEHIEVNHELKYKRCAEKLKNLLSENITSNARSVMMPVKQLRPERAT